jgi:DNA-binding transcriptional regulator/RsmH inhibitor MraZ
VDQQTKISEPIVELPRVMAKARIDDKGRIKLAADYLHYFEALPEQKVFVTSLDGHIAEIYPISAWRDMEKFLAEKEFMPEAVRAANFASVLGGECLVDGQGRVSINADLRRVLGLDGQELHIQPYKRNRIRILSETAFKKLMADLKSADPEKDERALIAVGRP